MLNIWKMDFYRLFKTKSLYVIWIVMAGMLLFTTVSLRSEYKEPQTNTANQKELKEQEETSSETENLGMYVMIPTKPGEKVTVYDLFYANVQGKTAALFIAIFAVLFTAADDKSGYIKNIGGQVRHRSYLILSKASALLLFTVLTFAFMAFVQGISNRISFGYFELGPAGSFAAYFGTELLLHYAFALIVMGITILVRSSLASMITAICLCMNFVIILYGFIGKMAKKLTGETFDIISHTVSGNISGISMDITEEMVTRGILTSVIYGAVFVILGMIVFEKRDIR